MGPNLHWCAGGGNGGETDDVAEVDGHAAEALRGRGQALLQAVSHRSIGRMMEFQCIYITNIEASILTLATCCRAEHPSSSSPPPASESSQPPSQWNSKLYQWYTKKIV